VIFARPGSHIRKRKFSDEGVFQEHGADASVSSGDEIGPTIVPEKQTRVSRLSTLRTISSCHLVRVALFIMIAIGTYIYPLNQAVYKPPHIVDLVRGHTKVLKPAVNMVPAPARVASHASSAEGGSSSSEERDSDASLSSSSSSQRTRRRRRPLSRGCAFKERLSLLSDFCDCVNQFSMRLGLLCV
jgi:hypothetical protein